MKPLSKGLQIFPISLKFNNKKNLQNICLPDRKGIVHVPVNDPTYSLFTVESCSHFFFRKNLK